MAKALCPDPTLGAFARPTSAALERSTAVRTDLKDLKERMQKEQAVREKLTRPSSASRSRSSGSGITGADGGAGGGNNDSDRNDMINANDAEEDSARLQQSASLSSSLAPKNVKSKWNELTKVGVTVTMITFPTAWLLFCSQPSITTA